MLLLVLLLVLLFNFAVVVVAADRVVQCAMISFQYIFILCQPKGFCSYGKDNEAVGHRNGCWTGTSEKCCEDCRNQCRERGECQRSAGSSATLLRQRHCFQHSSQHYTHSRHWSNLDTPSGTFFDQSHSPFRTERNFKEMTTTKQNKNWIRY